MNDLSLIQEYLICTVNEKGVIPGFNTEKRVCLLAAGLFDLQLGGCISIDDRAVHISAKLPPNMQHLKPLYDFISRKKAMKIDAVIEDYCASFTDQLFNTLTDTVMLSLTQMGLTKPVKAGLLGNRFNDAPTSDAIRSVVEMMRAEFLEDGMVTQDAAALIILLEKAKCLKVYFSAFEQKEMRQKLQDIVNSPEGTIVSDMVEHIETLLALLSMVVILPSSM